MKKPKLSRTLLFLAAGSVALLIIVGRDSAVDPRAVAVKSDDSSGSQTVASPPVRSSGSLLSTRAVSPGRSIATEVSAHRKYFDSRRASNPGVSKIYDAIAAKLPKSTSSALIAEFIAEFPLRTSTPEFAAYMNELKVDLGQNRDAIFQTLLDNEAGLKADGFQYQMVLNLISFGDFTPEQKLRILGGGVNSHFEFDKDGVMTFASTNITNALILMKKNGITGDQVQDYVDQGLRLNQGDVAALAQYKLRVQTYYPELGI